jgi:O-antigen/teichoic acid export membrane protein
MMKVAILYICTGRYAQFFDGFYKSAEQYLLQGVEKHYFVFTDQEQLTKAENVELLIRPCRGFPEDSLFRFDRFLEIKDKLKDYDYTFFFNANMRFVAPVGEELLEERLTAVLHPGFFDKPVWRYPYERNKQSKAYIPAHEEDYHYYMGSLNGGKTADYLALAETCSLHIHEDWEKGIVACYHDESHLNRYLREHHCKALSPAYAYIEGKELPFEPKILLLDKTRLDPYFNKGRDFSLWGRLKKGLGIVASATFWSMTERIAKIGIQVLCTFIIAQFVAPSAFGLVSMMSIFLAFSTILIDSGFSQAIIHEQNVTKEDESSIFWFNILLGGVVYGAFYAVAPLIAAFYREPQLTLLIRVAFTALIFQSFVVVQQGLLFKQIDFKAVSKISFWSVLLSGVAGIVVSYLRHDVWGLIVQNLTFAVLQTFFFWFYSHWRPQLRFKMACVRKYLRFSMNLLGSNMLAAITDNLANLVVGRAYSTTVLGHYTMANKIPYLTSGTVCYGIKRVSYSMMSKFQNDDAHLASYSQRVVGTAFWILAPIMVLLFVFAKPFIALLFPEAWAPAAIYLRYFCVIGFVFCFSDVNQDILLVKGRTDLLFRLDIVRRTLLVILLIVGVQYNVEVLLALLAGYNVLNGLVVSYLAGRLIGCSLWQQVCYVLGTPMYYLTKLRQRP